MKKFGEKLDERNRPSVRDFWTKGTVPAYERGYEIDTKLKLAKREFRNGLYIEEMLK